MVCEANEVRRTDRGTLVKRELLRPLLVTYCLLQLVAIIKVLTYYEPASTVSGLCSI